MQPEIRHRHHQREKHPKHETMSKKKVNHPVQQWKFSLPRQVSNLYIVKETKKNRLLVSQYPMHSGERRVEAEILERILVILVDKP